MPFWLVGLDYHLHACPLFLRGAGFLNFMRTSVWMICLIGVSVSLQLVGWRPAAGTLGGRQDSPEQRAVCIRNSNAAVPVLNRISEPDPETSQFLMARIVEVLRSSDGLAQAGIFTNELPTLVALDPWLAARWATSPEAGSWRPELMRVIACQWAAHDPDQAMSWVSQLSDLNERDTTLSSVVFQVAGQNPRLAVQLLNQSPMDARLEIILGNLVQQWSALDPAAALAWVDNYPAGELRDHLYSNLVFLTGEHDPAAAARMIATSITSPEIQAEAAFAVVDKWAWVDPSGVRAWVNKFPDGELKTRAQTQIARIAAIQAGAP